MEMTVKSILSLVSRHLKDLLRKMDSSLDSFIIPSVDLSQLLFGKRGEQQDFSETFEKIVGLQPKVGEQFVFLKISVYFLFASMDH